MSKGPVPSNLGHARSSTSNLGFVSTALGWEGGCAMGVLGGLVTEISVAGGRLHDAT